MRQAEYHKECIAVSRRNLSAPNVRYPNGRMSHDVEREQEALHLSALADMQLDGFYNADGRFVEYADGTPA